jgi:cytochrome d ubiquinol oxidase subunit I
MMTQAEAVTPSLTGGMALFTLIGYVVVYALVFSAGVYYLMRVLYVGLEDEDGGEHESDRPSRPLSAAHVPFEIESGAGAANHARPANEGGH